MIPILRKNQQGIAMLIAIMVLSLGGSIALIAYRTSTQELEVSRFTEHEMNSEYLAESAVDQVVAWVIEPTAFPNTYPDDYNAVRSFFASLPTSHCSGDSDHPDLSIDNNAFLAGTDSPFSELKIMGEITEIKFYAPLEQLVPPAAGDRRLCTLEVTAISGKGATKRMRVDLASSAIGQITAGIQGLGTTDHPLPIWTHWGKIHYTGEASFGTDITDILKVPRKSGTEYNGTSYNPADYGSNIDPDLEILVENNIASPLPDNGDSFSDRPNVRQQETSVLLNASNPDDPDQVHLRRFLKTNGEHYIVSSEAGKLEKNGHIVGTFDDVFGIPVGDDSPNTRLAWISIGPDSSTAPLPIDGGRYKGYFFFSGDISIQGNVAGRDVIATTPAGEDSTLSGINLEGLFYTSRSMTIQNAFKAYGAFFSRGGFSGAGTQELEVWYNSAFEKAVFPGIRSVAPLPGSWATLDSNHS